MPPARHKRAKAKAQRTRKPTIICHTLQDDDETETQTLCGAELTGARPPHFKSECDDARHKQCDECERLIRERDPATY